MSRSPNVLCVGHNKDFCFWTKNKEINQFYIFFNIWSKRQEMMPSIIENPAKHQCVCLCVSGWAGASALIAL